MPKWNDKISETYGSRIIRSLIFSSVWAIGLTLICCGEKGLFTKALPNFKIHPLAFLLFVFLMLSIVKCTIETTISIMKKD